MTSGKELPRNMTVRQAYRSLRNAQKSNRGAPAYSRWINRPVGRVVASTAYRAGLTPNQVTALSAAFTYSAIGLLGIAAPSSATSLAVALMLLMGYALDSADGQLARLTNMGRPSGEWLDHVIDMGKLCLLNGAVALSWVRWGVSGWEVPAWGISIPLLFLTVSVVAFFGWLLADLLIRIGHAESSSGEDRALPRSGPPPAPVLRSLLRTPSDYGLLALTFAWFATPLFFVTFTLLFVANAVILLAAVPVWFRQVRASEEKA